MRFFLQETQQTTSRSFLHPYENKLRTARASCCGAIAEKDLKVVRGPFGDVRCRRCRNIRWRNEGGWAMAAQMNRFLVLHQSTLKVRPLPILEVKSKHWAAVMFRLTCQIIGNLLSPRLFHDVQCSISFRFSVRPIVIAIARQPESSIS